MSQGMVLIRKLDTLHAITHETWHFSVLSSFRDLNITLINTLFRIKQHIDFSKIWKSNILQILPFK